MKFRFCGDQDCPEWFLTQMATLSRLSSVKAKLLAQLVARHITGQEINLEKSATLAGDAKLPDGDFKPLLAALQFTLESASRFMTEEDHLRAELQQIGLPREHATALAKVYQDFGKEIRKRLLNQSLIIDKLEDVEWKFADNQSEGCVALTLGIRRSSERDLAVRIVSDPFKLQALLFELERIKTLIVKHGLNSSN